MQIKIDPVKMVEMYRAGATLRDIASEFDCSLQRVHQRLRDCDEPLRPRGYRKIKPIFCEHCGNIIRKKRNPS